MVYRGFSVYREDIWFVVIDIVLTYISSTRDRNCDILATLILYCSDFGGLMNELKPSSVYKDEEWGLLIDSSKRSLWAVLLHTPRKKFYLNLRNRFFYLISLIRTENIFITDIHLFCFKKSRFYPFFNESNYFFNIIYLI